MEGQPKYSGINVLRDQYYMVRKLGGGGFGTVYMVQRKTNKEMFAAKHQKFTKPDDIRYGRNELAILEKMKENKAILYLEEYFESGLQSVILTEYLEGGELFERISSKEYSLTEDKCRMFVQQVVSGVAFMHEHNIIHLDLKPNNVVCVSREESNLQVKIIDFGLAKDTLGETDIPISTCGTPEFMAPEVMKCTRASAFSDLWSLGVVIFMLVTGGFSPFYSRNQYKMQRKILRGNYNIEHESFSGVSRQAKDLVRALLVVDPSLRLSAKQCLTHSWLESVSGSDSSISELRRLETQAMRRWLARRRWTRVYNAVVATLRLAARAPTPTTREQAAPEPGTPEFFSSEQEIWL